MSIIYLLVLSIIMYLNKVVNMVVSMKSSKEPTIKLFLDIIAKFNIRKVQSYQ